MSVLGRSTVRATGGKGIHLVELSSDACTLLNMLRMLQLSQLYHYALTTGYGIGIPTLHSGTARAQRLLRGPGHARQSMACVLPHLHTAWSAQRTAGPAATRTELAGTTNMQ